MKEHADDQGCPLIRSEGDRKGIYCRHYTLNIQTHIPSFRRLSPGFYVDKLPVSPLAEGHDQHIVLFPRLSLLLFIEQGLGTISVLTPILTWDGLRHPNRDPAIQHRWHGITSQHQLFKCI